MLLIGSRAAKYRMPEFRQPKDYDIICTKEELTVWLESNNKYIVKSYFNESGTKFLVKTKKQFIEFEFVDRIPSSKLFYEDNLSEDEINIIFTKVKVAKLSTLLLIKKSHLHVPLKWDKHIEDYSFLKREVVFSDKELEAFVLRRKEISDKKVNLNMSNDSFFDKSQKSLQRVFVHDGLHEATCYYKKPLFDTIKLDKSSAFIKKSEFDSLDYSDKIKLVHEECFAIALERYIIPNFHPFYPDLDYGTIQSFYHSSLRKICTGLSTGWFRDFIIDNYWELKVINYPFYDRFLVNLHRIPFVKEKECFI